MAFGGTARQPARIIQTLGKHRMVHIGMLTQIERGQMKAEGTGAQAQATDLLIAGVYAAITAQTVANQVQIGDELLRILIAVGPALIGVAQTL